ncbi:SU10 major capsid protein, partial [Sinorhizobium meliloti]
DYYEGPFGTVMIHPNRVQAVGAQQARNAFFLDTDMVEFLWLDKIQEDKKVAKTGDADKGVIIGEGTLKVKNEKGLGVAADLFGLTAAS